MNDTPPNFEDFSTIRFWNSLEPQHRIIDVNLCRFSEDTLPGEVITRMVAYDADLDSRVKQLCRIMMMMIV